MKSIPRIFIVMMFIFIIPLLLSFSSAIENRYFPVIVVKPTNVSSFVDTDGVTSVRFQIQGHKYRDCSLSRTDVYWKIDKIQRDGTLYRDDGVIYTFPLSVKSTKDFITVPIRSKIGGKIPDTNGASLVIHYVYYCHPFYNNEFDLIVIIPPIENQLPEKSAKIKENT